METSNQVHPAGTRYVTVVVTSLDDSINVENIDVNRGNCRIDNQKYLSSKNKETILPAALRYGQSVRVNFIITAWLLKSSSPRIRGDGVTPTTEPLSCISFLK